MIMFKKLLLSGAFLIPFLFSAQEEASKSEPKISLIPSVGYAWRLAKMPSGINKETRDYIKGLKTGLNVDISAYYHLKGNSAVGVKYSNYRASSDGRLTVQGLNGENVSALVTTRDHISFVGPAFMSSNFKEDTKHKLFYDIALGVITYTSKTGFVKGTGSNLGLEANFAYQYAVTDQIFIGPKLGLTGGTLSKMKYNGTTVNFGEDQKEGLSRLSLSAAVTFRF